MESKVGGFLVKNWSQRATKDKYHDDILTIHALLSAIMLVVSSQQRMNLPVYMKNCKDVNLLIANYKWVKVNHILHGLIHHSGELIVHNDWVCSWCTSEEGLEATNKFIRCFLELLSQKTSPIDLLTDVMSRLLGRSNPKVVSKIASMNRKICCKICLHCNSNDHSTQQHQEVAAFGPWLYYDELVDSMVIDDVSQE